MKTTSRRFLITLLLAVALWGVSRLLSPGEATSPIATSPLNPMVKVELTALSGRQPLPLEIDGHWRLLDGEHPQTEPLHHGSGFHDQLRLHTLGAELGALVLPQESLILEVEGDQGMRLGYDHYPGRLWIRVEQDRNGLGRRQLRLSLEMPLEEYVLGVVCGEMPSMATRTQAALQAQAIAARTYALFRLQQGRRLRDDARDQVFRGIDFYTEEARRAVQATRGQVLIWEGDLLPTYFHRNCGGATADALAADFLPAAMAPLKGAIDPQCRSPRGWEERVDAGRLDRLAQDYSLGDWLRAIATLERDASGRMLEMRLLGEKRHVDLPAESVRAALSLPSMQWEEMRLLRDGSLLVRGNGYGHGVGLCQEGAMAMARQGAGCDEILAHYYPDAQRQPLTTALDLLLP